MLKRFWKWLGFHVHDWSNWETQGEVKQKERTVGHWQTRHCNECKKLQAQTAWLSITR